MKIAVLILLGLCAFTAQAQLSSDILDLENLDMEVFEAADEKTQNKILDYLQRTYEYLKSSAAKRIEELQEKIQGISEHCIDELKMLAEKNISKLQKLFDDANMKYQQTDGSALECFEKYRPQLLSLVDRAKTDIENLVTNTLGEISGIVKSAQGNINAILVEIGKLKDILGKCVRPVNPIYTFKCLLDNVKNIQNSLKEIIGNTAEAVQLAVGKLRKIVRDARNEIENIINRAQKDVEGILENVRNCLKEEEVLSLPEESSEELKKLIEAMDYIR